MGARGRFSDITHDPHLKMECLTFVFLSHWTFNNVSSHIFGCHSLEGMLVSRGGKTKDTAKHSVTTKTGFIKEYLTKYQTNENIQPTRVLCYMVNHENGVSPYPSHCHAWSPWSHKILLGHLPHPIPKWPLYQVQDEMLEIRCRERNSRSSFLCMPDRGCELHTFLWTAHAWAVSAWAGFSLYRSNSRHLGSAGSAASPPLCCSDSKAARHLANE